MLLLPKQGAVFSEQRAKTCTGLIPVFSYMRTEMWRKTGMNKEESLEGRTILLISISLCKVKHAYKARLFIYMF